MPLREDAAKKSYKVVIEPREGVRLVDFEELREYRDLFFFLIWRNIKVRYAQSTIGIGWAVIQPLFSMGIFTIIFGNIAKIDSNGVPYAIFSFTALVPWTYFTNAVSQGTSSLVSEANMIRKVYFPRLILPLAAVAAKLVDFSIAMLMLVGFMIFYHIMPTMWVLLLPLLIVMMMLTAAGMGLWLTALAVQYRDVNYAMSFVLQLLMYAAPVVYPTTLIPDEYRLLYAINPMVGVIEGFRSVLLGTIPVPWDLMSVGIVSSAIIAVSGMFYFLGKERVFADVA